MDILNNIIFNDRVLIFFYLNTPTDKSIGFWANNISSYDIVICINIWIKGWNNYSKYRLFYMIILDNVVVRSNAWIW